VRRVLAAFDLTPVSRRVAERARVIAEAQGAQLVLVHVDEPLREAFIERSVEQMVRSQRRRSAEDLAAWVRQRGAGDVELTVESGSPAAVLGRMSRGADLVVVGTSSVDAARIGPIAARMARTCRVPLLAVRRRPRTGYRRVVVAVDLSPHSARAVETVIEQAPDAEVTAVFALSYRFEWQFGEAGMFPEEVQQLRKQRRTRAEEKLDEFIAQWDGRVPAILEEGPPSEVLEEVVRRRSADLVAVGRRGWGGAPAPLLGTVAEQVLGSVPCDVLIAR
jgi:nucleotide-binding universal stress UspA family protein